MRGRGAIVLVLWATCSMLYAQEANQQNADQQEADCQAKLSEAENNFAAGRFYGIPSLLQQCIDGGGYSREERVRVHMLLSQTYLLTDDPAKAEASYLELLSADPEFVASEAVDPIDIVYLSKKFTTTPIFTPHFKVGPNFSTQYVLHEGGTISTPEKVKTERRMLPGVSLGAGIEWNINDNLGIGGEALFSYKAFRTTTSGIFGNDILEVRERQMWADIPFYVRYGRHIGTVRPYGYGGYAINLLFADRLNMVYTNNKGSEGAQDVQGPDPSVMYKRHILNGSLVFGGGIKYKFGKNFLLFDLRYMRGLTDVVIGELNQYADAVTFKQAEETPRYAYVGPLFRVSSYSFSFGFVRPLYDPRKVTKANTKAVERKISRE